MLSVRNICLSVEIFDWPWKFKKKADSSLIIIIYFSKARKLKIRKQVKNWCWCEVIIFINLEDFFLLLLFGYNKRKSHVHSLDRHFIGVSSLLPHDNFFIFQKESDSNVTQLVRCPIKWRRATYNTGPKVCHRKETFWKVLSRQVFDGRK